MKVWVVNVGSVDGSCGVLRRMAAAFPNLSDWGWHVR